MLLLEILQNLSKQRLESPTTQCLGTSIRMKTRTMLQALVPKEDTEQHQRSTKGLLSRHKEHPRKVPLTYLRVTPNMCQTSQMSRARCAKRVIGCLAARCSEESRLTSELVLFIVEVCEIIVLCWDTWPCLAQTELLPDCRM